MRSGPVLAVLPARGGSKGVEGKNLRPLGGRPLLHWAGGAALAARSPTRVICSTDSPEIASVARTIGIEVPFMRPSELATDEALVSDVLIHCLRGMADQGAFFSHVALLQPTSPFVLPDDVDRAVELARESGADTVITGYRAGQRHPSSMFTIRPDRSVEWVMEDRERMRRRQDLEPVWIRSGMVYVFRSQLLLESGSLYGPHIVGMEVPEMRAVNLDREDDFLWAEFLLRTGLATLGGEKG